MLTRPKPKYEIGDTVFTFNLYGVLETTVTSIKYSFGHSEIVPVSIYYNLKDGQQYALVFPTWEAAYSKYKKKFIDKL
jgi:hypothetical protein